MLSTGEEVGETSMGNPSGASGVEIIRFSNGSNGKMQEGSNMVRSRGLTELSPFGVQINAWVCVTNGEVPTQGMARKRARW